MVARTHFSVTLYVSSGLSSGQNMRKIMDVIHTCLPVFLVCIAIMRTSSHAENKKSYIGLGKNKFYLRLDCF